MRSFRRCLRSIPRPRTRRNRSVRRSPSSRSPSPRTSRSASTMFALQKILTEHKDEKRRLRALWAFDCIASDLGKKGKSYLDFALEDKSPEVRAWAVQLTAECGF